MTTTATKFRFDTDQGEFFSFPSDGKTLRDKGMAKVEAKNEDWMDKCLSHFRRIVVRDTFTGEDIRRDLELYGLLPTHHNAWGCLIRELLRSRLIERTGGHRAMKVPRSHARMTPIYRRCL